MLPLLALVAACSSTPGGLADRTHKDIDLEKQITLVGAGGLPIVRNDDGTFCYGPMPDAALDEGVSGGVNTIGVSSFSGGEGQIETPLGGRNPNVLITRDIFFQTCLAESRLNMNRDERMELLHKTLEAVVKINTKSLDGDSIKTDTPASSIDLSNISSEQKDPSGDL